MLKKLFTKPLVSICIPAYRCQNFISETIDSALNQTVDDLEIVVSNDGGYDIPDLNKYRSHPKLRIIDQSKRLGWVENSNRVLSLARGYYFMILPHDDVLYPEYIEACLNVLLNDKSVYAAYSDIDIGTRILQASEARGTLQERVIHVMRKLFNGYSYRALMPRRRRDLSKLKLHHNPPWDFASDTIWMLQQACLGELRRVPRTLYLKRIHQNTARRPWRNMKPNEMLNSWNQHCNLMGNIAMKYLRDEKLVSGLVEYRLANRNFMG